MVTGLRYAVSVLLLFGAAQPSGSARVTWRSIGPDGFGTVSTIASQPGNGSLLLAGTLHGIWRSTEAGATWAAAGGVAADAAVSALLFDRTSPTTAYAVVSGPSFVGLLRSVDSGQQWAQVSLPSTLSAVNADLAQSSDGQSMVLAAGGNGNFRSDDGGLSWQKLPFTSFFYRIRFVGTGSASLIGSTSMGFSCCRDPIMRSTDGGATWTALDIWSSGFTDVVSSASEPDAAYVVGESGTSPDIVRTLYRVTDTGSTALSATVPTSGTLWIDPVDPRHIIVAGADAWESVNQGATWTRITSPATWAVPLQSINRVVSDSAYGGSANRRVYFATSAGVWKTDDVTALNTASPARLVPLNAGLSIAAVADVAADPVSGRIAAVTDSIGLLLQADGSTLQTFARAGDVAVDPDTRMVYVDAFGPYLYRMDLDGQHAEYISGFVGNTSSCKPAPYEIADDGFPCWLYRFELFKPHIDVDRARPGSLLAAGSQLWRTDDATAINTDTTGPAWRALTQPHMSQGGRLVISTFAIAPGHSDVVWIAYDRHDDELVVSTNAMSSTPTWTPVTSPVAGLQVTGITIDARDSQTVYVATAGNASGVASPSVWRTRDGGATWTAASGSGATGLPAGAVNQVVMHPFASNVLYAATSAGVYRSGDRGETWEAVGPVSMSTPEVAWRGTELIAASEGRGLFVAQPKDPLAAIDTPHEAQRVRQPFVVAGWSLDEVATADTGIDEVAVSAYPLAGGAPIALGLASYGLSRPDVASAYGPQFDATGYSATVSGLPLGRYRIVVTGRSSTSGAIVAEQSVTVNVVAKFVSDRARASDVDGDGAADFTVYRPATGEWYTQTSGSPAQTSVLRWGLPDDVPVPGDYDGDGLTDRAVYRPSSGEWWVCLSSTQFATFTVTTWGLAGDVTVPADYDGDGVTDVAMYRPSEGGWYILLSTQPGAWAYFQWGAPGDIPMPGDYDDDLRSDPAVFRPSTGEWFVLESSTQYASWTVHQWGVQGDVPVTADFDGDGVADLVVFRPMEGTWYIATSTSQFVQSRVYQWGLSGDVPIAADYDGDGISDLAVWRPSDGVWYVRGSASGVTT